MGVNNVGAKDAIEREMEEFVAEARELAKGKGGLERRTISGRKKILLTEIFGEENVYKLFGMIS